MSRFKNAGIIALASLAVILQGACSGRSESIDVLVSDLAKLERSDVERRAIQQHKIFRIEAIDGSGRRLGYSEFDSLGRVKCNVSNSLFSSSTCFEYGQTDWPVLEIERSDTDPQTFTFQYLFFQDSRHLYALKANISTRNLAEVTCYRFDSANRVESVCKVDFVKQDSSTVKYVREGDLLRLETSWIYPISGGISEQEVAQGLMEVSRVKTYFYSPTGVTDSTREIFKYQTSGFVRREVSMCDSLGLEKSVLVTLRDNINRYIFYHAIKF